MIEEQRSQEQTTERHTVSPQRTMFRWFVRGGVAVILILVGIVTYVQFSSFTRIHRDATTLTRAPVAIVLGASVNNDGTPSDALQDRIQTAANLYHAGTVRALLLTGDDGRNERNEIQPMVRAAREAGVPERDLLIDGEGYRTYESCKRAVNIFHITHAIVVTQRFHLGRALFLCNHLGMSADGFTADRRHYVRSTFFWSRDLLASVKAFWDVYGG
jgi:SanA protein